jgi:hypothetical protein
MFATVRRYNVDRDKLDELVARVQGVEQIFKQLPGHVAYYLVRSEGGTMAAVAIFEDRAVAESSSRVAAKWIRENVADLMGAPTDVTIGEVVAHG